MFNLVPFWFEKISKAKPGFEPGPLGENSVRYLCAMHQSLKMLAIKNQLTRYLTKLMVSGGTMA